MRLKVKFLKISAGRPVVFLHKNLAENSSIHVDERVILHKKSEKIIAVVDIATGVLREDEIAVSTEVKKIMNLKEGEFLEVSPAPKPKSLSFIMKKLSCKKLSKKEIQEIMNDIVENHLTESEIAFFISGVYECGMNMKETADMIEAIVNSGKKLELNGQVADKHSIGGVPGRTTPIVVSICACTVLIIPKTSSRAITAPAGTADAVEVLCRVDFSIEELKKIVKKTNACLVWGGALNLAPADDKIIQVEKLVNLDPEPQLLASILAKKLSVDAKYILIEIPYGKNAKVNKQKAEELSRKFKALAKHFHVKLECFLHETKEPVGKGIGPALEIKDVIKVLKREDSCNHLEEESLKVAGKLLELTGKAEKSKGYLLAKKILESGKAYQKFKEIILAQHGKLNGIKEADFKKDIFAEKKGTISEINIKLINELARVLGCPSDKLAGMYLYKHLNDKVDKGDCIATFYAESKEELEEGIKFYKSRIPIIIK